MNAMNTCLRGTGLVSGVLSSCARAAVGNPQENSFWVSAPDFGAGTPVFSTAVLCSAATTSGHRGAKLPYGQFSDVNLLGVANGNALFKLQTNGEWQRVNQVSLAGRGVAQNAGKRKHR